LVPRRGAKSHPQALAQAADGKVVADSAVMQAFLEKVEQSFAESDDAADE
jgi:hypothetical protein